MKLKKMFAVMAVVALSLSAPIASQAAGWQQEADGRICYLDTQGEKFKNMWMECAGRFFYLGADGYILANTVTPDGRTVGADGAFVQENVISAISYTNDSITQSLIVSDYLYEDSFSTVHFLEITNVSPYTVSITINDTAKNPVGAIIGAANDTESDIPAGCTVFASTYFSSVHGAASFDTSIQVKEDPYYIPVLQGIAFQTADLGDKVMVTATNLGDKAAEFPKATALFFKDGQVVDYGSDYLTDADSELKPGAVISGQINSYSKKYDSVKVHLTARRSKWSY